MRCVFLLPSLLSLLLLFPALRTGAAGEPYGKFIVLADAPWMNFAAASPDAESVSGDPDTLAALRAQLEAERERDGPYAPALAETLGDIARQLEGLGDEDAALQAWGEALHLTRVAEGLYSPAQGPLVRGILDNLRRQNDYDALDQRYEYFFRLYGAGRAPFTAVRFSALLEYLGWQREALRRNLRGDSFGRLLSSYELHEDILDAVWSPGSGATWTQIRDLSLSHLQTLYLLEDMIEAPPVFANSQGSFGRPREDPLNVDVRRQRLENLQRSALTRGRSLLESVLAIVPPEEPQASFELALALADWLQWQGRSSDALHAYGELWATMQEAGFGALARAWFDEPRALPDSGVFWAGDREADGPLSFTVAISEQGRARVVGEAGVDESQRGLAGRMRRLVNSVRFRPRFVDGRPVEATLPYARYLGYRSAGY